MRDRGVWGFEELSDRVDRFGLMRVRDAAEAAGLHPDTVRRWIRERRIPAYGWRGAYRVSLEDLLPLVGVESKKS